MDKIRLHGYTLLELLITLGILSLLLLGGTYFSSTIWNNNKAENLERQIVNILQYSRNLALTTGKTVALNPIASDWSQGVILFVDNKSHRYQEGDELLRMWQWKIYPLMLKWEGFLSADFLIFSPQLMRATSNGHFTIYQKNIGLGHVVVNRLGRIKSYNSA